MSHKPQATAGAVTEVEELVQRLNDVRNAISRARSLGVPVQVPEPLYQACLALIDDHNGPRGGGGVVPTGSMSRSTSVRMSPRDVDVASPAAGSEALDDLITKVPLRQMLWQVITPGEEFTVTDVTERLERRGLSWPANKVSNALGYWVSRRRLERRRKGVYLYPEIPVADDLISDGVQRESPAGLTSRAAKASGGEEHHPDVPETQARQAM
jgi:hypothetical protein